MHDLVVLFSPCVCPRDGSDLHCIPLVSSCGVYHDEQCCPGPQCEYRSNRSQFAIRVNIRNHDVLKRDDIIRQVASVVGPGHKVDLKNYDLLILIELYKVCPSFRAKKGAQHKLSWPSRDPLRTSELVSFHSVASTDIDCCNRTSAA